LLVGSYYRGGQGEHPSLRDIPLKRGIFPLGYRNCPAIPIFFKKAIILNKYIIYNKYNSNINILTILTLPLYSSPLEGRGEVRVIIAYHDAHIFGLKTENQ